MWSRRPFAYLAALLSAFPLILSLAGCGDNGQPEYQFDPAKAAYADFSGDLALKRVKTVCDFGPRPPGSEALESSRRWIEKVLAEAGWTVQRQTFTENTPIGKIEFVNLRARYPGLHEGDRSQDEADAELWQRPTRVLLASHYDTKKYETIRFVGANDPGSSIGVLLEVARVAGSRPDLARHLELVFFDGEEAFVSYTAADGLFGSRYYARQYRKWPDGMRMEAGILFDMVGDKDLNVRIPRNSPAELTTQLFAAALELGSRDFFGTSSKEITDDHLPLNDAGLPTIDIIDLDYAHWHTSGDSIDKLSAESLQTVGRAALLMVEKHLLVREKSE